MYPCKIAGGGNGLFIGYGSYGNSLQFRHYQEFLPMYRRSAVVGQHRSYRGSLATHSLLRAPIDALSISPVRCQLFREISIGVETYCIWFRFCLRDMLLTPCASMRENLLITAATIATSLKKGTRIKPPNPPDKLSGSLIHHAV